MIPDKAWICEDVEAVDNDEVPPCPYCGAEEGEACEPDCPGFDEEALKGDE